MFKTIIAITTLGIPVLLGLFGFEISSNDSAFDQIFIHADRDHFDNRIMEFQAYLDNIQISTGLNKKQNISILLLIVNAEEFYSDTQISDLHFQLPVLNEGREMTIKQAMKSIAAKIESARKIHPSFDQEIYDECSFISHALEQNIAQIDIYKTYMVVDQYF
jgi:hypothetical protein